MVLLDKNGIRCDGRKVDEPRRIMIRAGKSPLDERKWTFEDASLKIQLSSKPGVHGEPGVSPLGGWLLGERWPA